MSYFRTISLGEIPERAIWLPFLDTLAAQVEGCDVPTLLGDATRWANALPRIAKLVEAKVVAVGFLNEHCLEAFSAIPDEPWRHDSLAALLECIRRLAETIRPARELAVALPGPARICRSLGWPLDRASLDRIKPGLMKLLEMACECRPDLVVIDESGEPDALLATPDYRRICSTLKNVTEYFGIPLGLRVAGYDDGAVTIRALRALRLDHLLLGQSATGYPPLAEALAAAAGQGWQSLGLPLADPDKAIALPRSNPAGYWCSPDQETDLELARKTGQALAA
ncbi:hypothetical protein ACLIKD_13775 [Azonexus sp. IMCC34842]|uniref:hypothetical protein n=1 Tax=Azonexus sp. IMCC34842 TaxID=3420950 RepID=UPI003D128042